MTILRMIAQLVDKRLVAAYLSLGKRSLHGVKKPIHRSCGSLCLGDEVASYFGENIDTPRGLEEFGLGDAQRKSRRVTGYRTQVSRTHLGCFAP